MLRILYRDFTVRVRRMDHMHDAIIILSGPCPLWTGCRRSDKIFIKIAILNECEQTAISNEHTRCTKVVASHSPALSSDSL